MRSDLGVHKTRSLDVATDKRVPAIAKNDDLLRQTAALIKMKLECGPMLNLMAALRIQVAASVECC